MCEKDVRGAWLVISVCDVGGAKRKRAKESKERDECKGEAMKGAKELCSERRSVYQA